MYLVTLPAGHNFPLACPGILGTLLAGGRVVMLPSPEPERAFATVAAEGVTARRRCPRRRQRWLAPPPRNKVPAADGHPRTSCRSAAPRMADEIAVTVRPLLGATLQQVFGMAEGLLNYTRLDDPDEVICTTQGRPLSAPATRCGLSTRRTGTCPTVTGRAADPRALHATRLLPGTGAEHQGVHPGRVVPQRRHLPLTPDGNLVVEGRDKDMINRGGEKITAEEVENLVYQLPGSAQVAAVAMPDPSSASALPVHRAQDQAPS